MRDKPFLLIAVVLLTIASVALSPKASRAAEHPADVRVMHALSGTEKLDFYLNDVFAGGLDYAQSAPYILVPPGSVKLRAFAPGTGPSGKPLFESTFSANDGQHVNVALIGTGDDKKLGVFPIDLSPLPAGQGRIHIICSSTGWAEYTLTGTAADGKTITLAEKLAPGASATITIPVGLYTLKGNGLAAADPTLSVNAGTVYSAFVTDVPGQRGKAADLRVFSGTATLGGPAGYVRIVHAVPDGQAVDAYIGETLIASRLRFGESTVHIAMKPGKYDIALYVAGSGGKGTPIKTSVAEIAEGASLTSIAAGTSNALTMNTYTDDRSAPPAKQSRVTIFNARAEAVDVTMDGKALVTNLGVGQISKLVDVPEGVHTFSITAGGKEIATLKDYSVSPNTAVVLRTLVVTSKDIIVLSARPIAI